MQTAEVAQPTKLRGLRLKYTNVSHENTIHRMAWSSNGRFLATPDQDEVIHIWDVQTGEIVKTFSRGSNKITCLTWSQDDTYLFVATDAGVIKIWDVKFEQLINTMRGYAGVIFQILCSPTQNVIAYGGEEGVRFIDLEWDLVRNTPTIRRSSMHYDFINIQSIAWSPDGTKLLSISKRSKSFQMWDGLSGDCKKSYQSSVGFVNSIAWSPNGRTVALCALDFTIRIWDAETGHEVAILEGHMRIVTNLSFSGDGQLLASKGYDDSVRLWRCDTWEIVTKINEPASTDWLSGLAFNPNNPFWQHSGMRIKLLEFGT